MRPDTIVAIVASIGSLLTAAGGVWVAIRNAGRDSAIVDQRELKATRAAWLWAVRTITKLRSFIARIPDVEEPADWNIDEEMRFHERRIAGEELEEPKT